MRSIPKTIDVFGKTYTVRMVDFDSDMLENKYTGRILYSCKEIYLAKDMPTSDQQETFLHEVCHGLLYTSGLKDILDSKTLEAVCNCIGNGLSSFVFGDACNKRGSK